ncbi:myosin heavy chain-like protein [Rhynchospora pubera]|uniref:Myosin heavy chain-like protein n=1 Tax=Rhynchospora pubera TaxID=906938 RepID=A0AAV8HU17_9POAL|nr:myosin heavy chain-like protein [Rhynchospora pubera]
MDRQREKGGDTNGENSTPKMEGNVPIPRPFMGVKDRRFASFRMVVKGDYLDVESNSLLSDILSKRGDQKLLFADRITKLSGSGKIKQRAMMITDRAIYLADVDSYALRRRIPLASVDRICLSKLKDNFFALIIPTEYDCLMASTRKTEIVSILVEATKIKPAYEISVVFSNRIEYRSSADTTKIVLFEEIEGGIKTRIINKTYR